MSKENTRKVELPPLPPDEEIFRWHGLLVTDHGAMQALYELADEEGMSYQDCLEELQRKRYRYSQVQWPLRIGEEPRERMPYRPYSDGLTTNVGLPTGKTLGLTTYPGTMTQVKLSEH
jgi:hypothetical protein